MMLCYLALGSNLRTPARQLRRAIQQLRKLPGTYVIKVADFHTSKAWGRKIQPDFSNTVLEIQTILTPERLLSECQKIERTQGRLRLLKWGARTLDIDILLYDSRKIDKPGLTIPHPHMLQRDFVLVPLLEIAPLVRMPGGQRIISTVQKLLACHPERSEGSPNQPQCQLQEILHCVQDDIART